MSDEEHAAIIESIAANVRRLREHRGWTQEKLAEEAGVDIRLVQRIESGRNNPTATTLALVTKALGVKIGLLFRAAKFRRREVGRPSRRPRT